MPRDYHLHGLWTPASHAVYCGDDMMSPLPLINGRIARHLHLHIIGGECHSRGNESASQWICMHHTFFTIICDPCFPHSGSFTERWWEWWNAVTQETSPFPCVPVTFCRSLTFRFNAFTFVVVCECWQLNVTYTGTVPFGSREIPRNTAHPGVCLLIYLWMNTQLEWVSERLT